MDINLQFQVISCYTVDTIFRARKNKFYETKLSTPSENCQNLTSIHCPLVSSLLVIWGRSDLHLKGLVFSSHTRCILSTIFQSKGVSGRPEKVVFRHDL